MGCISKTVLITGSQGFTGRYMAAEMLAAGYRVIGTGSHASNSPDYRCADLTDPGALKAVVEEISPDVVIHLAGLAFVGHGDANAFYQVNLIGTRNLLDALANSCKVPDAVLLASSANVYGNSTCEELLESTPAAPANDYAVSKLAMEHMARLWMDRLPLIITRPFNYTGVGQSDNFLLPKLVSHFRARVNEIELGNLDVCRDFGDVRATVNAYRRLIEVKAFGQVVNVCSGRAHSLREVLAMCEDLCGHSIRVSINPAYVRSHDVKVLRGSAQLLRSLIGDWDPPCLKDTLHWMLEAK